MQPLTRSEAQLMIFFNTEKFNHNTVGRLLLSVGTVHCAAQKSREKITDYSSQAHWSCWCSAASCGQFVKQPCRQKRGIFSVDFGEQPCRVHTFSFLSFFIVHSRLRCMRNKITTSKLSEAQPLSSGVCGGSNSGSCRLLCSSTRGKTPEG